MTKHLKLISYSTLVTKVMLCSMVMIAFISGTNAFVTPSSRSCQCNNLSNDYHGHSHVTPLRPSISSSIASSTSTRRSMTPSIETADDKSAAASQNVFG
eukprot:CAMPEP_0195299996 /NCGR_PEP_ID=MMETSP0707-20130614/26555_1 /TAXON_ID=33640 /ORGANISM="Asterionellopsis glacialis, Strain CCMP134" /LENGTH=98 /DNA_ID=CAMNT_0040362547 /DNA_START=126 /DNA_END=418 /DNA_ORIENTATION=-